mmetsp:Transcript_140020/g.261059  ORF Transcript_140020/g.261059 Transcript_140020/m.261059 type:complete len:118 (+) Transcript_140020:1286-1639(+)
MAMLALEWPPALPEGLPVTVSPKSPAVPLETGRDGAAVSFELPVMLPGGLPAIFSRGSPARVPLETGRDMDGLDFELPPTAPLEIGRDGAGVAVLLEVADAVLSSLPAGGPPANERR